ncbi:hypothetical protein DPEC_G00281760 [Dallia pectoralis]|uniref:Uncharacterized protein n=1 Tax=Dallia pectoralis TaxID=75939 RepID=A0ACC2FMY6_DALPE|nr:hypothetical protein DPEC_G00281760 [Dallia pectoralis]
MHNDCDIVSLSHPSPFCRGRVTLYRQRDVLSAIVWVKRHLHILVDQSPLFPVTRRDSEQGGGGKEVNRGLDVLQLNQHSGINNNTVSHTDRY